MHHFLKNRTINISCRRVQEGDGVFMDYQVYDGSNKLDSSFDNGRQYSFTVGSGAVIKQVDKAIREMCVGEQRKISLPYKFGETFPMSLCKCLNQEI